MANYYFVATKDGRMPSKIVNNLKIAQKGLKDCQKGWPDQEWATFVLEKNSNKSLSLPNAMDPALRELLTAELKQRNTQHYKVVL